MKESTTPKWISDGWSLFYQVRALVLSSVLKLDRI